MDKITCKCDYLGAVYCSIASHVFELLEYLWGLFLNLGQEELNHVAFLNWWSLIPCCRIGSELQKWLHVDLLLGNWFRVALLEQGGWTRWPPDVLSSQKNSMKNQFPVYNIFNYIVRCVIQDRYTTNILLWNRDNYIIILRKINHFYL